MRGTASLFALAAFTGVAAIVGMTLQLPATAAKLELQKNPIPMSDESIKTGRLVYARVCRACHGLQAKGDGVAAPPGAKPANLVDEQWTYGGSDAEIFKTIKDGIAPYDVMQPWGRRISDNDIWHIVNHLRDLAKRAKR